ncbi:hypothetical protein V6N11_035368 [Hibiscus sabdariffa]|uniref:Uncharacterized protein n=2 Tax=Hibiscus sabdariffa TaxID=183260 RepID=A0ABR1ZL32_9ROSI
MEELEARTLNYPTILTDPLLMGILIEDGSHFSRALDWAVNQKLKPDDDGEVTTHTLFGIWSEVESPGHTIMATLGLSDAKAKGV